MNGEKIDRAISTFIMGGMIASIVVATAFQICGGDAPVLKLLLSGFGAVCGVAGTVLAASGNILTFVFGLVDVSIYSVVLVDNAMWAQSALHLLYFLPMEFVGFFSWKKRGATARTAVQARRLDAGGWILTIVLSAAVFVASGWISYFIGRGAGTVQPAAKTCLDALITTANIVGLVLMSQAYLEQWYLWVVVNVFSIAIWILNLRTNPDGSYTVVIFIKYIFYLLNSVNAIRIWLKLSGGKKTCNQQ